jgi:Kef-type K+ transport system membrane component KefB
VRCDADRNHRAEIAAALLIIMFLATGILSSPSFLGIIHSYEQIELLAHIGKALLLFIVGLKLDLNLIRITGPVALATGLGQIIFTSLIGFAIAVAMSMSCLNAAYVNVLSSPLKIFEKKSLP